MNRPTSRLSATLRLASVALVLVYQLMLSVPLSYAQPTPPTPPTPPAPPSAPEAPEPPAPPTPPEAPSAPTAPEAPSAPNSEDSGKSEEKNSRKQNRDRKDKEKDKGGNTGQNDNNDTGNTSADNNDTNGAAQNGDNQNGGGQVGDSSIETGDTTTTAHANNSVNQNVAATVTPPGSAVELTSVGNGSGSSNNNTVDLTNNNSIVQVNDANVNNQVEVDSNTGGNSNSKNVGNSTTTTGDANVSATIVNNVNTNAAGIAANEFNVNEDYVGDLLLDPNNPCGTINCGSAVSVTSSNQGNGSGSNNSNDIDIDNSSNTFQSNTAEVDNTLILSADSGNNVSDKNTGGDSSITTGDANVSASVVNFINNNVAGQVIINTVNIFGDLIGDIIAPESESCTNCGGNLAMSNQNNGSGSDNNNQFSNSENDSIFQENDANIINGVSIDTNTGGNIADKNTGGDSSIRTGESNVDVNVMTIANNNVVGGNWWIVLVNQAGTWLGRIMGAPEGANMAGSVGTEFRVDDNGNIAVSNSGNGSNSENSNDINQSSSDSLTQTNEATVNNNLQLSANTGNNSTSKNTGGDNTITTGDANVVANLVNFINNNIAGDGQVTVTVVNVFGSWLGNFVAPGTVKEEAPVAAEPEPETAVVANESSNQEEARGGLVSTSSNSSNSDITTVVETESGATATVDQSVSSVVRQTSRSWTQQTSTVLGLGDDNGTAEESGEVVEVADASNATPERLRIQVTWPALITTGLGILYAGLKARGLLIG